MSGANYSKLIADLQTEIAALKAAKLKSANTLRITTKSSNVNLTLRNYGYYWASNAAKFTLTSTNGNTFMATCTIDRTAVGTSYAESAAYYLQPRIIRTESTPNSCTFMLLVDNAFGISQPSPPTNVSWPIVFTATAEFNLSGPTYVNLGWIGG